MLSVFFCAAVLSAGKTAVWAQGEPVSESSFMRGVPGGTRTFFASEADAVTGSDIADTQEMYQSVDDVVEGTILFRKDRWKAWVLRMSVLLFIDIMLLVLIRFLPKKTELDILPCYFISGVSFVLSLWLVMGGFLISRWVVSPAIIIFSAGITMLFASWHWFVWVKDKDTELSAKMQELIKAAKEIIHEDGRLTMLSGAPGELSEIDFCR